MIWVSNGNYEIVTTGFGKNPFEQEPVNYSDRNRFLNRQKKKKIKSKIARKSRKINRRKKS